jgi:hypothetical protein
MICLNIASSYSCQCALFREYREWLTLPLFVWGFAISHPTIIRGENARSIGHAPVRVEIYLSEGTVEISSRRISRRSPEERRRFAILNIPRYLFSEATAAAARRGAKSNC